MYKDLICAKITKYDKKHYNKYRNKLNHIMRISERLYYRNLLQTNKNNLCKTWKILNQVINRKKCMNREKTFNHNGGFD